MLRDSTHCKGHLICRQTASPLGGPWGDQRCARTRLVVRASEESAWSSQSPNISTKKGWGWLEINNSFTFISFLNPFYNLRVWRWYRKTVIHLSYDYHPLLANNVRAMRRSSSTTTLTEPAAAAAKGGGLPSPDQCGEELLFFFFSSHLVQHRKNLWSLSGPFRHWWPDGITPSAAGGWRGKGRPPSARRQGPR